jgi:hypothetical protein
VIRHWWTGAINCKNPQRGRWGGPPDGQDNQVIAASKLAFAPRGKLQLGGVIMRDLWEIGYKKERPAPTKGFSQPPAGGTPGTVKVMGFGLGALGALAIIGLVALVRRRRR